MGKYLTKSEYAAAKRRLTMAEKRGDRAVIEEVLVTFASWDAEGVAYPDDWARWTRALGDAEFRIRLRAW